MDIFSLRNKLKSATAQPSSKSKPQGSLLEQTTFIIDKHSMITNLIKDTNDGDEHVKQATVALQNPQSREY